MFGSVITVVIGLLSLALPIGIIALIVYFAVRHGKNAAENNKLDMKTLLRFYLYLISFITLIVGAFGLANAVKAGLSYPLEYQFSYNLDYGYSSTAPTPELKGGSMYEDPYYKDRDKLFIDGRTYYVDYKVRQRDVVNGLTIFISMILLFAVHRVALTFVEPKDEGFNGLKKFYNFLSLIVYSLIGIIALPTAIYSLMNYYFLDTDTMYSYSRSVPGEPLAIAIVMVPLWILFLVQVIMQYRKAPAAVAKKDE
jgi:heme/copper-type cytochrome/quinol oxidase subunit 2